MDNAIFSFPKPINEPVKAYAPGSSEKSSLKKALAQLSSEEWDIPLVIGGKEIRTGNTGKVVMPHDHHHVCLLYTSFVDDTDYAEGNGHFADHHAVRACCFA